MNSFDEVSFKLGELNTGQKGLFARVERQDKELAAIRELLTDLHTKVTPVVADMAVMKPHVDHYAGVRKRAGWLHSVILGIAGLSGGSVTTWLIHKLGG